MEQETGQREALLLHTDFGSCPALINALISDNFEALGISECVKNQQDVIHWIINKKTSQRWVLSEFAIKHMSHD